MASEEGRQSMAEFTSFLANGFFLMFLLVIISMAFNSKFDDPAIDSLKYVLPVLFAAYAAIFIWSLIQTDKRKKLSASVMESLAASGAQVICWWGAGEGRGDKGNLLFIINSLATPEYVFLSINKSSLQITTVGSQGKQEKKFVSSQITELIDGEGTFTIILGGIKVDVPSSAENFTELKRAISSFAKVKIKKPKEIF